MKRLVFGLFIGLTITLLAVPGSATNNDPHHEEQDGCDHGNTSKPCRPDPQPDHGQDCVEHGNHGGINEDHCLVTTTTTRPNETTTTTTAPPATTTTTTQPPTTVTTEPPVSDTPPTTSPPAVVSHNCVTPDGYPYSAAECLPAATPEAAAKDTLPRTGSSGLLLLIGLGSVILGFALRRFAEV